MTTTSELARKSPEGELPTDRLDAQSRAQLYDLAKQGHRTGDDEGARDILHGLVVLNRQDSKAWSLLGRVEHRMKHLDDAADALSKALSITKKDWDTALELAEVHTELKQKKEAEALLTYVALEAHGLRRDQVERLRKLGGRS